ncbi:MAG TPA: tRNA preQ1(34) S-adenosylmethionine ribosyltransferase-isomerase QueA [Verrucomicrobiae bacterium]|jgi:S-adenosylmethionine:tRNA ribosyltransferase-isomerase|nr:tRNA preQ1(34) S-adenosylmethionine ribosyltransferase-isomerase QueA [Verrucomicrobiae bacterium]
MNLSASDFDYQLPPELIAQEPLPRRDQSRLLVYDRKTQRRTHAQFRDLLAHLQPGDALVLNNSRVIPARLRARNPRTDGRFEILLVEEQAPNDWWAMVRPGKRAPIGATLELLRTGNAPMLATVTEVNAEGHRRLRFSGEENILTRLDELGEVPLPPYIARTEMRPEDRARYQTVYADAAGSVAAPTAGLHFTPEILDEARRRGAKVCFVTLHVGLGTFAPVKVEALADHVMHSERFIVSAGTAAAIAATRAAGGRVWAVGTTSLRVLESAVAPDGTIRAGAGRTALFAYPPFQFRAVDVLVTNFHLPRSTLLMLVSAFAAPGKTEGRASILALYEEAVRERYRFFSYGDAMLVM